MEKPEHIVHILPYLETGGTESHVLTLIRSLNDLSLCSGEVLAPPGPFAQQLAHAGVKLTTFTPAGKGLVKSFRHYRRSLASIVAVADLVHVHGAPDLLVFTALARLAKRPRILTVHGFHGAGAAISYRFAATLGNKLAQAIICVSQSEEKLLKNAGACSAKLHLVYNGVADPTKGDRPSKSATTSTSDNPVTRIAFVGRLSPVKGVDVLLQALAMLARSNKPPAHLAIMGTGPQEAALQSLAADLGVADIVSFHGYCPNAAQRLRNCDIFCLPSREDMGPLVCVEAMAQSKPIVSTWVGGIPEMVTHGSTGILTPAGDANSLAQALGTLISNPQLRYTMGAAGRKRYEMYYTEAHMARQTYAVYCSLMK